MLNYKNSTLVVCRYNENTDFLVGLTKFRTLLYEKENEKNKYNIVKNKGHEATVYLKYIIDHYDKLSEYTIFIHCHEHSWHHSGSIVDIINNNLNKPHTLTNLNNFYLGNMNNLDNTTCDFGIFFRKFILPATGKNLLYPNFTHGVLGCAQFIVHKSRILLHSKLFYENIFNWLLETEIDNYWTSRFLEWTWDLFWNKCTKNIPIKKYLNEYISDIEFTNKLLTNEKENIITFLNDNNYFYVDDNEIIITISNKNDNNCNKIVVKNQYIYNKYV
jgi:hypothetical protein